MTEHLFGSQRFCAVCLEHVVYSPADYTCPACEPQKPCPTAPLWNPAPVGGPARWGQATA